MVVFGIVLLISSIIAATMVLMNAKMTDLTLTLDRITARYVCEAGATAAILDISNGTVSSGSKSIKYAINKRVYNPEYTVKKVSGQWYIDVTVDSPMNFSIVYKLHIGGTRAFPFFIKGPGSLM